jgi:hypothetical protein
MICWSKDSQCQGRARLRKIRGENVVLCDWHAQQYEGERYEIGYLLARHYNDDSWLKKDYPHYY